MFIVEVKVAESWQQVGTAPTREVTFSERTDVHGDVVTCWVKELPAAASRR